MPAKLPRGFYLDLWLLRREMLERLRAHPGFVSASQRLAARAGQRCDYASKRIGTLGPCDAFCRQFSSLEDAQHTCDQRPSCVKILNWATFYELRGASIDH